MKNEIEKWENEFFERLRDKLEEIFPKTNQDNPEIPSEGNRSGALAFNAWANIIFKKVLEKALDKKKEELVIYIQKEYDKRYQEKCKEFGSSRKTPNTVFHDILKDLPK